MILETERLILRKMTQEDYPALCRMLQDPLCMYAYAHAFSDEEAQQWLDKQLSATGRTASACGPWCARTRAR